MGSNLAAFDRDALSAGFDHLVGVDEAGRGCLAGPVVAAAVALPEGSALADVDDSKKLTPARREAQLEAIRGCALAIGFSFVGPRVIERLDIRRANLLAMRRAVGRARRVLAARCRHGRVRPACSVLVLVDGVDEIGGLDLAERTLVRGDGQSLAIAAASIVAKTLRDRFMIRLGREFPAYGFERHKGYGTEEHLVAIDRDGPCTWHRMSFAPIAQPSLFAR